jgi:hypothetical protein
MFVTKDNQHIDCRYLTLLCDFFSDTILGICYVFPVIHIISKIVSEKKVLEEHSPFSNCHITAV